MSTAYRAYLTPLYSSGVYGEEIEISDDVKAVGGTITKSIDSTDFSVGIYTFNDVTLSVENAYGKYSESSDSRSVFTYARDKAKIRIVFDNGEDTPPTTYDGLINEELTQVSPDTDEVNFTVLGPDSVLKNSVIPAGSVTSGMTVTQALVAILNTADVRSVLGVSLSNLNPQNDIVIDDGTKFDNQNKRDAIAQLLAVSSSVLLIDDDLNVIVRDRLPNYDNEILYLYGKGDAQGRENIVSIPAYNSGLHRTFNSVAVTGGQASAVVTDVDAVDQTVAKTAQKGFDKDLTSQALYGVRPKEDLNFGFITDETTLEEIAAAYVSEFAFAKLELQVTVPTAVAASSKLLDQVSVNFPLATRPAGKFLPIVGITKIGDTDAPLPHVQGAISIASDLGFKIIEKSEEIGSYLTTLKLRQVGTTLNDGVLIVPTLTRLVTLTADGQTTTADDLILIDATLGDVDVKAVSPVSNPQKQYRYLRIDVSRNRVRLLPYASEYFNGDLTSIELEKKGDGVTIETDRTGWYAVVRSKASIAAAPQKRFTLTNNQAVAANITGLLLDSALYRSARITCDVRRKTDTALSEARAIHSFFATYNAQAAVWTMQPEQVVGDDDGVTLTLTTAGQAQYTSTNVTGTNGIHNLDFSVEAFNV